MPLSNSHNPLVSVIMGVHNERSEHLVMAIDSICTQTYKMIEFIIIDDYSNESCKQILQEYEKKFDFIRVIHNDSNLGLTKSLNIGIRHATGVFIARMDADDFSVPTRIEKQVKFLNENKTTALCGTGVVSFGDCNVYMSPYQGLSNNGAQCSLFFSSTLCHPSVMIRRAFLEEHHLEYDESIAKGQDYDLWERCSVFGELAVMREVLLFYRIHSAQITSTNKSDQDYYADRTRLRRLSRIGVVPSEEEYKCHMLLARGADKNISYKSVKAWVTRLITANNHASFVHARSFSKALKSRLVLYKLRNRRIANLLSLSDVIVLAHLCVSRMSMSIQKKREVKKFHSLLADVENR